MELYVELLFPGTFAPKEGNCQGIFHPKFSRKVPVKNLALRNLSTIPVPAALLT